MATYPSTVPNFGVNVQNSRQQPIEDLVIDTWPNGSARGRSYFTTGRYSWELYHGTMADADRATLKTFYDTNRLITFSFVSPWDGVTYTNVIFAAPPEYIRLPGLYWDVKVKLRQI
jgi:hypothetical protein